MYSWAVPYAFMDIKIIDKVKYCTPDLHVKELKEICMLFKESGIDFSCNQTEAPVHCSTLFI